MIRKYKPVYILTIVSIFAFEYAHAQNDYWIQTKEFTSKNILSIACDSSGNIYAGTGGDGIFRSTNQGVDWNQLNSDLNNMTISTIAINPTGSIYAGAGLNGIYRSTNSGENWQYTGGSAWSINNIAVDSKGKMYAAMSWIGGHGLTSGLLLRSDESGSTWVDTLYRGVVYSVNVNAVDDIFISYSLGKHVARSTDSGKSFQYLVQIPNGDWVNSIAFGNDKQIYFASDIGISRSTDNGDTWTTINNGLSELHIKTIIKNINHTLYAISWFGGGSYYSTNNGDTWIQNNTGLVNLNLQSIAIDSNGILFVGTSDGKVFRSRVSTTFVNEFNDIPILNIALKQNYPNPFNPITSISFTLTSQSFVTLKIFDLVGREIATLVSEELTPGVHVRQWNATILSGGVYFYRLQVGIFSETRKLILVK